MRRITLSLLFAALVCAACESSTPTAALARTEAAFAKANTTKQNQWFEIPPSLLIDNCSGEVVRVSGRVHVQTTTTDPGDGSLELQLHSNYAGVHGIGETTGLKYNLVGAGKQETIIFTPSSNAVEIQAQVQLVSQGSADNWKRHVILVFIVDEDGLHEIVVRDRTTCN